MLQLELLLRSWLADPFERLSHGPSRAAAGWSSLSGVPEVNTSDLWCCPSCNCNRVLCCRTPAIGDLIRLVVMVSLDKHSGFPGHLSDFSPLNGAQRCDGLGSSELRV